MHSPLLMFASLWCRQVGDSATQTSVTSGHKHFLVVPRCDVTAGMAEATIRLTDGTVQTGFIYTIDPETDNIVLLRPTVRVLCSAPGSLADAHTSLFTLSCTHMAGG